MKDRTVGMLTILFGVIMGLLALSYHIIILDEVINKQLFHLIEGISLTITIALICSGVYFILRHRLRARFDDLRNELSELTKEEIIIYDLIKKKIPLTTICEKTTFSKNKVKETITNLEKKGMLTIGKKGRVKITDFL